MDVTDFSDLYRTYAGDVHRFALFLSGDPALADDIVSETFIRLWHARARVDVATVKGYLLTIARNLFLDGRRHAGASLHWTNSRRMPGRGRRRARAR
jgi:RNA polymerase sigma-70 factor, ECF subfamily